MEDGVHLVGVEIGLVLEKISTFPFTALRIHDKIVDVHRIPWLVSKTAHKLNVKAAAQAMATV